jgi:hypothetical protein
MSDETVSNTERVGVVLLVATVGALVCSLVAHPLVESSLAAAWRDAGGDPAAVTFKAQEAFVSGGEIPPGLAELPVTKIHSAK